VLLELAADAIEEAGASRERPIEFDNIRTRYLPEGRAHTKAQHRKAEFAIRAAAMIHAGVDPDLLGEVRWWRTDDFFCLGAGCTDHLRAGGGRTSWRAGRRRMRAPGSTPRRRAEHFGLTGAVTAATIVGRAAFLVLRRVVSRGGPVGALSSG
jgi:hypothetical protein